jgi:hypothetical protein
MSCKFLAGNTDCSYKLIAKSAELSHSSATGRKIRYFKFGGLQEGSLQMAVGALLGFANSLSARAWHGGR